MKTKILTFGILIAFFAFVSCEKEEGNYVPAESELNDEAVLKSLRSSSRKKTRIEARPNLMQATCGESHTFELWYWQDFAYGTVTVSNDNEFLYIQYDLNKDMIDKGWGFHTTYLFVGDYSKLPYTDNGINVDWHHNLIDIETYNDNPTSVVRKIKLKDLPDCFGIATKAKLNNPDPEGMNPNPRAFLNIDEQYKYPWQEGYEYCIQDCCGDSPGTGTQGYWHKVSHWEDWGISEITIGGILYSAEDATDLIKEAGPGDKTYDMFAQLVAAKLNVQIGNCSYCIDDIIASADAWMASHTVGSGVHADSDAWKEAEYWHTMLDDYNNGKLCAPHRD